MNNLKKKLNFLFYKINLKFYSNTKNLTKTAMPVDLLREEIQVIIFVIVTIKLKSILIKISELALVGISPNLVIDSSVKFLTLSSKQKIFRMLGLNSKTTLEGANNWLLKKIQIEEYTPIFTIVKLSSSSHLVDNTYNNLLMSLLENVIIKITNYMVYEIFSDKQFSKTIFFKLYTADYLLFSYNLINLKTYLYWKYYIENIYLNIKRFSTDTYPLIICTKHGLEEKRLYNKDLYLNFYSSNLQKLLSKSLDFVDYLKSRK
nr:hypothetical protein [Cryptomonas sp. NIES-3952]